MATWTSAELNKIGNAEELLIASLRADDTLRKPVIIWVVRLGDELYVRSVNGRNAAWFRGVQVRHQGQVVGDQDRSQTEPLLEIRQQVGNLGLDGEVQAGEGLVQD